MGGKYFIFFTSYFFQIKNKKNPYLPKPGNLPCLKRERITIRMMTATMMTILFIIRLATLPIILMNILTAVVGGWDFTCDTDGTGTGVAVGVTNDAWGTVKRAKQQRWETCTVTIPVAVSKLAGSSCQVPEV